MGLDERYGAGRLQTAAPANGLMRLTIRVLSHRQYVSGNADLYMKNRLLALAERAQLATKTIAVTTPIQSQAQWVVCPATALGR